MFLRHLLILAILHVPQFSWANPTNVKEWIIAQDLDPATTSLQISSLRSQTRNWKWNPSIDLDHLAGKKILIASKMLQEFPPGFQFETKLEGPPLQSEGLKVSVAFLCLQFGKDPWFDSERMWFLVNELTRTRLKSIETDFFIDPKFQFPKSYLQPDSESLTERWIKDHLQNRKIEIKGKVLWKNCPTSGNPLQVHAKSPSRSTLALLNDLMSSKDPKTTARFETIFLQQMGSTSAATIFGTLTEILSESRFFPEFAGSLPQLTSGSQMGVRGLLVEEEGSQVLLGLLVQGAERFSILLKTSTPDSKKKKSLSGLDFQQLTSKIPSEGKK